MEISEITSLFPTIINNPYGTITMKKLFMNVYNGVYTIQIANLESIGIEKHKNELFLSITGGIDALIKVGNDIVQDNTWLNKVEFKISEIQSITYN